MVWLVWLKVLYVRRTTLKLMPNIDGHGCFASQSVRPIDGLNFRVSIIVLWSCIVWHTSVFSGSDGTMSPTSASRETKQSPASIVGGIGLYQGGCHSSDWDAKMRQYGSSI